MEVRNELLAKLEEIVNRDVDVNDILKEVEVLKRAFGKTLETETNKNLEDFIGSGGEPKDFTAPKLEGEEKFDSLIASVIDKKQKKENDIKNGQEQNLKTKQDLVEELRDIIHNEENISKAFNRMTAVKDKWKATGEVSPHAYKDLQYDYSKLLEEFFYHINIYKELKDNDFKKNLQQREELIVKMRALIEEKSIKTTRTLSGAYLSEWDEVGPVSRDEWARIREEFRAASKQVFDRIKSHFTDIKDQRKNNLEKKQELLKGILLLSELDIDNVKTWKKKTDEVLAIQKQWKSVGFAEK
jgi:predicted XRE-type DNA-binding protein